jgi:hypothetical protein
VPCLYVHGGAAVNLRRRRFADANSNGHSNSDSDCNVNTDGNSNSYTYTDRYANGHGNCDWVCATTEVYTDAQAAAYATSTPISSSV